MLASLAALLLSFVAAFAPPPPPSVVALPTVAAAAPFGVDSLVLLHADGSITVASALAVVVLDATPNGFGMPSSLGVREDDGASAGTAGPHTFSTQYNSATGSHTVTTPCSSYPNLTDCAARHRAAVLALQTVFPKV